MASASMVELPAALASVFAHLFPATYALYAPNAILCRSCHAPEDRTARLDRLPLQPGSPLQCRDGPVHPVADAASHAGRLAGPPSAQAARGDVVNGRVCAWAPGFLCPDRGPRDCREAGAGGLAGSLRVVSAADGGWSANHARGVDRLK